MYSLDSNSSNVLENTLKYFPCTPILNYVPCSCHFGFPMDTKQINLIKGYPLIFHTQLAIW